jgi:hypothetical protein
VEVDLRQLADSVDHPAVRQVLLDLRLAVIVGTHLVVVVDHPAASSRPGVASQKDIDLEFLGRLFFPSKIPLLQLSKIQLPPRLKSALWLL